MRFSIHDMTGKLMTKIVAAMLLFLSACAVHAAERPNMLIILGDDMTYTDLGCFGNPDVKTPHLDRLASQGMKLTGMYSPAPMCAPLRMSLYSGLYPVRSRVHEGVESLPAYLRPLGYRVGIIGKRHEAPPEAFGFEYLGGRHHDGGKGVDLAIEDIRPFITRDHEQPYCLVVASNQPHEPWNRGDASQYDPAKLTLPPYMVDTPQTRAALARYYAEVTYLDKQVGQVLKILEETGGADNTLVMFFSEQGSSFPHCKWTCYDTGIRAAGIVRWPGKVAPGSESAALMQYVDVPPTLIDAARATAGKHDLDGRSFLNVLKGEAKMHRDHVFAVQTSRGIIHGPEAFGIRSVTDGRFKYIWNLFPENRFQNMVTRGAIFKSWKEAAEAGNEFAAQRVKMYQHRPEHELYDLKADPFELHNLAADAAHQRTMKRLRDRLLSWMKQQGDEGRATEMSADERRAGT